MVVVVAVVAAPLVAAAAALAAGVVSNREGLSLRVSRRVAPAATMVIVGVTLGPDILEPVAIAAVTAPALVAAPT